MSSRKFLDLTGLQTFYDKITSVFTKKEDALSLGETSTTAYAGDKGKTAYDFSQSPYDSNPAANGTASAGSSTSWSRGDHVHPTDTSREAVANKVTSWSSTLSDDKYPSEKLVKETLDSLSTGTTVKGDAESSYRSGQVNLTPANLGISATSTSVTVGSTTFNKYEHPTTTAAAASAVKVGNDGLGHVVLGGALGKSDVGLGNVDNTSDANKPVSTATQTELDKKEAVANKKQSIVDSSETDYPSSKAVADFVNSSVATNTANFLGTLDVVSDLGLTTSATNAQIATALGSYTWGAGVSPTNNDYCFVSINLSTTTDVDEYRRFKYSSANTSWGYEYTLNNSSFTVTQWNAINSGATSSAISSISGKYALPSGGIPSSDLASGVQSSLGKADSAIQSVKSNGTTLTPDANKAVDIPSASTSAYGVVTFTEIELDALT